MDASTPRTAVRVRTAMLARKVNRETLATLTGIPRTTLLRRLNGQSPFTIAEIADIAAVLEVDPAELVDYGQAA